MKTRGTGVGILLSISAAVVLAATAGCNATSVVAEKEAPQAVMVTNVPPPEPPASEVAVAAVAETPPVQMSLRPTPALPEDVGKVVQLVESGAGEEVVQAFVGASQSRYDLSLDQIVYLRDVGVSDGVIAAMMRRGAELREKDVEAATMQTNLVAAVEQIKQGLAAGEAQGVEAAPQATGVDAGVPATEAATAPSAVAVQAPQPPMEAPQPVQQFYTSLSPYGTWYQVPTYGWVWRPAVVTVDPTWMPYRHGGRWMWTDQGWYWNSEYSWGWAPFHYGRWTMYPSLGWCWTPDTVWGPSWVTWRHTGGYIGWAPLPPHCGWSSGVGLTWYGRGVSVGFGFGLATSHYTFVSGRRFGHRNLSHHAVRGSEHDGAYRQSTVVNNVINGNNNVIINNGIGYNQVASMTRDEIPKARVQPLPENSNTALRADRLERGREGLVVYRPTAVESVGGRPALRSEVRPAATSSSPGRSLGAVPSRPTQNSRFTGTPGSSPAKSVGSRGGGATTGANVPTASGARQVPTGRSPMVSSPQSNPARPTARPTVTTPSVRGIEARPGAVSGRPTAVGATPSTAVGPRRETAPVPLANPSRFLPQGAREVGAQPTRGGGEARGGTVNSLPSSSIQTRPLPATRPTVQSQPTFQRSTIPQRSPSIQSAPMPSRPSYSAPAPASVPSRPASVYSAPAPAAAPSRSPAMGSSRPSYSAPAPAAAPRPAPAAPAGGGGTPTRTGPRTQPN